MSSARSAAVGLVGLGAMGRGVAANLLAKGFDVVGFDLRPESLDELVAKGGRRAGSLADLARQCGIVVSFVVNAEQTDSVLFGAGALLEGWAGSAPVFIACSTMAPAYVTALGARLKASGVALLDAPVTGGAVGAERGRLTIMAAGSTATFERAKPVLAAFGSRIFHLGDRCGAGAQMKVINQLLCGVHLAAAGEAMAMAKRQGLPPDLTLEILAGGAGSSWMLQDRGPRMVSGDFSVPRSAVDIFVKDLGLVADAARADRFAAPLASTALLAFLSLSGRGEGGLDDAAVMRYFMDAYPPAAA